MAQTGFSKHRVEALADGIFAVAMTLLVIELKLPERSTILTQQDFVEAVAPLFLKSLDDQQTHRASRPASLTLKGLGSG